jgi:hypothetical protein
MSWWSWSPSHPCRLCDYAIHLGHIGNAVNRTGTVARPRIRVRVRAFCPALRVYKERIHFISRLHDLTFVHAGAGAIVDRWTPVGQFALFVRLGL